MKVLVIAHGEEIRLGWLTDALDEVGAEATLIDLAQGDQLPSQEFDRVVVLGGHMGAYDEAEYPWLTEEKVFIGETLKADTPVLGVCLGSQLIADVIGGRAYKAADVEVGLVSLDVTHAGAADASIREITGSVAAWHGDTFDLPPEAEILARTERHPHAFRFGSALGVQFHPEVTPEMWKVWTEKVGTDELSEAGIDPVAFQEELHGERERLRKQAVAFFSSWLTEEEGGWNETLSAGVVGDVQRSINE